jgi:hypothetical protein
MRSRRRERRPRRESGVDLSARLLIIGAIAAAVLLMVLSSAPGSSQPLPARPHPHPPLFLPAPDRLPGLYRPSETASQANSTVAHLAVVGGAWIARGPRPILGAQVENAAPNSATSGAIKAVAAHPTNANIIYVGAVNGGIWKTVNGTAPSPSWTPLTDQQASLSIGALKFDPTDKTNNTLLAGTGRFSSDELLGGPRSGLLRTTDGGASWTPLDGGGTLAGANIAGVAARGATLLAAVDVADQDTLLNLGVFRSVDTGAHFERISGNGTSGLPLGMTFDLAGDPANPATFYTGVAFAEFVPGASDGIYKSTDTGATWALVSDAAINGLFHDTGVNPTRNVKISVGKANNVYIGIENGSPFGFRLAGLFRSGDGGAHWTALDLPHTNEHGTLFGINPGGQGTLHFSIQADPTDVNVVYVGGDRQPAANEGGAAVPPFPNSLGATEYTGRLFRIDSSRSAGNQFAHLTNSNKLGPAGGGTAHNSSPHADSRGLAVDAGGNLLEVDDGGIFRRTSPRTNTGDWFAVSGILQVTEFHDIAYDGNARIIFGGTQDEGTPMQPATGALTWNDFTNGDGGDVETHPSATAGISIRYASSDGLSGFILATFNAANVLQSMTFPALNVVSGAPLQTRFFTPIRANALNPNRLIIGGRNSVYESLDQGNSLSEVGKGISANDGTQRKALIYGGRSGGVNNPNVIYVGGGTGGNIDRVFVRAAAAPAPFTELTSYPGRGSGREVNGIALDPQNYKSAYVVDPSHVYFTANTGASWTDVTGDIAPGGRFAARTDLDSIEFVRHAGASAIVVGSGHQVLISRTSALGTWNQLGTGLPNAHVERLIYNAASNILVAGLLGRGVWSINDPLGGPTPAPTGTPTRTPTRTPTPKPTATPLPVPPVIGSIPKVVLVGSSLVIAGNHFTPGSVLNFFVATSSGPVNAGPFTPASESSTQLLVNVPDTTPLGQGFVDVQVVNTDTGFLASNQASALLQGLAAAGIPSLTAINGVGLAATSSDPSFATNNVETVVAQGKAVALGGTGFDTVHGVAVDLFCACPGGKVGPFFLNPGDHGLGGGAISLTIPASGPNSPPTGPGSFVVINKGSDGKFSRSSNAVSVPIGEKIAVTSITQTGATITVNGAGFSTLTVINFFNTQGSKVANLGGLGTGGAARIPLIVTSPGQFTFVRPAGAFPGASYVQALNPPFVPFTSSGNASGGAFTLK